LLLLYYQAIKVPNRFIGAQTYEEKTDLKKGNHSCFMMKNQQIWIWKKWKEIAPD